MKTIKFYSKFASETLSELPKGLIDKQLCGCGMTTIALKSNENVVLAVPNVNLILNKTAQIEGLMGVYAGVTVKDIDNYVQGRVNKPIKIMVTYDSLFKVEHLLDKCRLVVDECHRLLSDVTLKSKNTPMKDCINHLLEVAEKYKDTVTFITATPIPLEYMPKWMSEIEYTKCEWVNISKVQPILMKRSGAIKSLIKEILIPLSKNKTITVGGASFSKVCVYLNTVSGICNLIEEAGLKARDCSILCGDTLRNDVRTNDYNKLQYNKLTKFNFITSSGFDGIDLYDKNAISVVVSTTKNTYEMIDMAVSLKQAISRLRNSVNNDKFIFIYNTSLFDMNEKVLKNELICLKNSAENTVRELNSNILSVDSKHFILDSSLFQTYAYKDGDKYCVNYMKFNADMYFLLEVRSSYTKGFAVYSKIEGQKPVIVREVRGKRGEYSKYDKKEKPSIGAVKQNLHFFKSKDYTNQEIKALLQKEYNKAGIKRTAKATDLNELGIKFTITQISNGNRVYRF